MQAGQHERTMTSSAMNLRWPRAGLGLFLGCLGFVAHLRCEAQNLVYNGSFEDHDTCLAVLGFYTDTDGPLGWFSASGSPDYYQGCLPNGSGNGIPQSYFTYQYAQDGEYFVGLGTYQLPTGLREYIMTELVQPLVIGQTYYVSFYASAAWNGTEPNPQHYIASSNLGALFTMQPRPWSIGEAWPVPGNFAHVYHPWVIADTVNWVLVSGSFVADSAYQYVMLGNHFNNALTDTVHFAQYAWLPKAYTLIDNVCISTDPLGCPLALTGPQEEPTAELRLFPNPGQDEVFLSGAGNDAEVRVMDALGRLMWQGRSGSDALRIDVQDWPRGSYLLRLWENGESRSFKFVLIE